MKKQQNILFVIALLMFVWSGLSAQNTTINFEGQYKDVIIPSTSKKYLRLLAKGGDGGKIKRSSQWGGGQGATVIAYFSIGTDANEIQTGGTLRFMIGGKGDSRTDMDNADATGVGGGGGTGIAYKAPGPDSYWRTLLVAGGGGGAQWAGMFGGMKGGSGKAYDKENIGDGRSKTVRYKEFGQSYESVDSKGSGAGAYGSADQWKDDAKSYAGWVGGPDVGEPTGGSGHDGGRTYYYSGGWGYGAGGIGNRGGFAGICGGGGGFTGGAVGRGDGDKSEGGISYVNEVQMEVAGINSTSGGSTTSPQNGFASYEFANITASAINWHSGSNWCIDNSHGITTDGNNIQLWTCESGNKNQKWVFFEDFTIRLENDLSKCLGLENNNASNNTEVQLFGCNYTSAQKWIFEGTTRMIRYHDNLGYCLTFDKDDASNGSQIYLYECSTDNIGQQWNTEDFSAANLSEHKVATIRPYTHQSNCIDNYGGKTDNGNKIQLWDCGAGADGNNNQKWFFDEDGSIRLSNHRDKCLSLIGGDFNNGDDVHLWDCKGQSNQQWIYDGYSKVIRFRSKPSKCLDLTNGGTSNGTQIQIWDCQTNNSNMQWTLEQSTPNYEDIIFGQFHLTSDTGKCLDLKSGNASNGANIQLYPCNNTVAQNWYVQDKKIKYLGRNGYCLAIDGSDNTNVHIWECKDQANEEWIFDIPFKLIRSRVDANKCLVVNGSNIEIGSCNYDPSVKINQQWDLPGGYSEILTGGNQQIHLGKDNDKCVDMASGSSGADVRVYECKNGSAATAQTFFFDGSRIRRADNHSLCLELEGGKTDAGTDIQLGTCTGSISSQKWMYDGISGRIHSKADPNKCMRFTNGFTSNYTNIKLSECDEAQAEIFVIE